MTSEERTRRIIQARKETQRLLNKELSYSEDLQHKDMVEMYKRSIEKLNGMLED